MPIDIRGKNVFTDPVVAPQDGEPVVQTGPGGTGAQRVYQALADRDVHTATRLSALETGATRGLRQVETLIEFRAMAGMGNAEHVYFAGHGFYRYAIADTTTDAYPYVIMPNSGVGRWRLEMPRLTDTMLRPEIEARLAGHLVPATVNTPYLWAGTLYTNNIGPQTGNTITAHGVLAAQRMYSAGDVHAAGNLLASGGILQLAGRNYSQVAGVLTAENNTGFMSWGGVVTAQHLRAYSGTWAGNTLSFGAGDADRWLFTTDAQGQLHLQFYAGGQYQYTIMGMLGGIPWFPRGIRLDWGVEIHTDQRSYASCAGGFYTIGQIHAGAYNGHIAAGDTTNRGGGSINCYGNLTTMYLNGVWTGALMAHLGFTEADIDDDAPMAEECHAMFREGKVKFDKARAAKEQADQEQVLRDLQDAYTKAEALEKEVAAQVLAAPAVASTPSSGGTSAPT